MSSCLPFGVPQTAKIWIIGHDPRLRKGKAEAPTCFFLDLLKSKAGGGAPAKAKRQLAQSVIDYISHLAGRPVELDDLYVTNLCNRFLPHPPKGAVVLIPNQIADEGVRELRSALVTDGASPRVIIPMSQQVMRHLVRTEFLSPEPMLNEFMKRSMPNAKAEKSGGYRPQAPAAFLMACGQRFSHNKIPVVPILHISAWRRMSPRYEEPMDRAASTIREILRQTDRQMDPIS